jgi:hypothetical protein
MTLLRTQLSNTPNLPSLSGLFNQLIVYGLFSQLIVYGLFSQLIVYGLFSQLIVYFIRIKRIEGTIYDMSKEIILTRIVKSCHPYLFLGSKNKTKNMNLCEMKF